MRTATLCLLPFVLAACGGDDPPPSPSDPPPDPPPPPHHQLVVSDVMVIDGTGRAAFPAAIGIDDGRITAILDVGAAFEAEQVLEGGGRHVTPGFVDVLTHVSAQSHVSGDVMAHIDPVAQLADTLRAVVEEPDAEVRLAGYQEVLRASLRGGVTTFVDSITSLEDVAALRARLDEHDDPSFLSLGPILSPTGHHPPYLDGTAWKRELPIEQDFAAWGQALRDELEAWFSQYGLAGVKVAVDSTEMGAAGQVPEEAIAAICEVAHAHDKPCFFLSYTAEGMKAAAAAGADVKLGAPAVIGALGISPPPADTWQALQDADVAILSLISTSAGLERYVTDPGLLEAEPTSRYAALPQAVKDSYGALISAFAAVAAQPPDWSDPVSAYYHGNALYRDAVLGLLAQARGDHGLTVLPTTSAGSAWVFHGTLGQELVYLHAENGLGAGRQGFLSTDEVIQAVTLDAARVMRIDGEVGSIEVGKRADLVLLNGDPYQDATSLTELFAVIKAGKVHELSAP